MKIIKSHEKLLFALFTCRGTQHKNIREAWHYVERIKSRGENNVLQISEESRWGTQTKVSLLYVQSKSSENKEKYSKGRNGIQMLAYELHGNLSSIIIRD